MRSDQLHRGLYKVQDDVREHLNVGQMDAVFFERRSKILLTR
jgi:hypothetical protein